jgi:hypothetical protein
METIPEEVKVEEPPTKKKLGRPRIYDLPHYERTKVQLREKRLNAAKDYYSKNKEKVLLRIKKYYQNNKEEITERRRLIYNGWNANDGFNIN